MLKILKKEKQIKFNFPLERFFLYFRLLEWCFLMLSSHCYWWWSNWVKFNENLVTFLQSGFISKNKKNSWLKCGVGEDGWNSILAFWHLQNFSSLSHRYADVCEWDHDVDLWFYFSLSHCQVDLTWGNFPDISNDVLWWKNNLFHTWI